MWFAIDTGDPAICYWLPAATVALKFCTALIGFVVAVPLLVRRIRRWTRGRR